MRALVFIFVLFPSLLFAQEKEFFTIQHALQKPDSVIILSLGDYRIDGDSVRYFNLDSTIQQFKKLEELKFTCNRIETIPEEIAKLKKLREVTITDEQNMTKGRFWGMLSYPIIILLNFGFSLLSGLLLRFTLNVSALPPDQQEATLQITNSLVRLAYLIPFTQILALIINAIIGLSLLFVLSGNK